MKPQESAKILQEELERLKREREEFEKMREALQAEFAQTSDHSDVVKKARTAIRDLMPDAILQAHALLIGADSESVRASLSKFIISVGLDKTKFEDESASELREMLKQFSAPAPPPVPSNTPNPDPSNTPPYPTDASVSNTPPYPTVPSNTPPDPHDPEDIPTTLPGINSLD